MAGNDVAIQATNSDASEGKASAVRLGYYEDEYIQYFTSNGQSNDRKAPVINRGNYARVMTVHRMVTRFINKETLDLGHSSKSKIQIVNLGAGTDTSYWRLKKQGFSFDRFVEVDFEDMVMRKCASIRKSAVLKRVIGDHRNTGVELSSIDYFLASADLRILDELASVLQRAGINADNPVLFIAEVVLVYMTPEARGALVQWISEHFRQSTFALYEPVLGDDQFSAVMRRNLTARQSPLIGALPDSAALMHEFSSRGWSGVECCDMLREYKQHTTSDEKKRLSAIEMFDEVEEWQLLMSHYRVLWATHS
eukprot:CFRG8155T1